MCGGKSSSAPAPVQAHKTGAMPADYSNAAPLTPRPAAPKTDDTGAGYGSSLAK
jgi:hypothetical protein